MSQKCVQCFAAVHRTVAEAVDTEAMVQLMVVQLHAGSMGLSPGPSAGSGTAAEVAVADWAERTAVSVTRWLGSH